jgi:hypothetical protein
MMLLVLPKFASEQAAGFANFGTGALECYKATVNESETINEAQPLCLVRGRGETGGPGATGFGFPVTPLIERS